MSDHRAPPPIYQSPPLPPSTNPMREIERQFEKQLELNRELAREIFELKAIGEAHDAAIRALLSTTPNLERVADLYMASMDLVADHIGGKHIELFRAQYQRLHQAMLAELKLRGAAPPS